MSEFLEMNNIGYLVGPAGKVQVRSGRFFHEVWRS